jgi:hypothetical protein
MVVAPTRKVIGPASVGVGASVVIGVTLLAGATIGAAVWVGTSVAGGGVGAPHAARVVASMSRTIIIFKIFQMLVFIALLLGDI